MPEFGPRIRPEEVDLNTRRRLARKIYHRESFALLAVFFPCLVLTVVVLLLNRSTNEPSENVWLLMSPIIITTVAILIAIHVWGLRERRFVESAVSAAAEVKEIETSYDLTHTHRLILKYRPMQHQPKGTRLGGANTSQLVVVGLESDLSGFTVGLHCGDSVSILYDPARPDHVCVVEEEHRIAA